MRFQTPLVPARLVRRYKRFLADVVLESTGEEVTAHCPNPGAMLGLKENGTRIWLEPNDDPKKKLKFAWRLSELENGHLAGIDTGVPNKVVGEALRGGVVAELAGYSGIRAEVPYGNGSRIDFLLTQDGQPDAYVEVKNVHLRRDDDWAEFPDCVTTRGAKHLRELMEVAAQGDRAVMLYLVQRTDCTRLRIAADLDPDYARTFDEARAKGVEVLCYGTKINTLGVLIADPLPVDQAVQALEN